MNILFLCSGDCEEEAKFLKSHVPNKELDTLIIVDLLYNKTDNVDAAIRSFDGIQYGQLVHFDHVSKLKDFLKDSDKRIDIVVGIGTQLAFSGNEVLKLLDDMLLTYEILTDLGVMLGDIPFYKYTYEFQGDDWVHQGIMNPEIKRFNDEIKEFVERGMKKYRSFRKMV